MFLRVHVHLREAGVRGSLRNVKCFQRDSHQTMCHPQWNVIPDTQLKEFGTWSNCIACPHHLAHAMQCWYCSTAVINDWLLMRQLLDHYRNIVRTCQFSHHDITNQHPYQYINGSETKLKHVEYHTFKDTWSIHKQPHPPPLPSPILTIPSPELAQPSSCITTSIFASEHL